MMVKEIKNMTPELFEFTKAYFELDPDLHWTDHDKDGALDMETEIEIPCVWGAFWCDYKPAEKAVRDDLLIKFNSGNNAFLMWGEESVQKMAKAYMQLKTQKCETGDAQPSCRDQMNAAVEELYDVNDLRITAIFDELIAIHREKDPYQTLPLLYEKTAYIYLGRDFISQTRDIFSEMSENQEKVGNELLFYYFSRGDMTSATAVVNTLCQEEGFSLYRFLPTSPLLGLGQNLALVNEVLKTHPLHHVYAARGSLYKISDPAKLKEAEQDFSKAIDLLYEKSTTTPLTKNELEDLSYYYSNLVFVIENQKDYQFQGKVLTSDEKYQYLEDVVTKSMIPTFPGIKREGYLLLSAIYTRRERYDLAIQALNNAYVAAPDVEIIVDMVRLASEHITNNKVMLTTLLQAFLKVAPADHPRRGEMEAKLAKLSPTR